MSFGLAKEEETIKPTVVVYEKEEEVAVLMKRREETLSKIKDVNVRKSKTPLRLNTKTP